VHVTAEDRLDNGDDTAGLTHVYGPPILFAIARDSHTIFVNWNIDWHSVFEKGMPVDRQVHLRIYRADGLEEKIVAVEPMVAMHYVTIAYPQGPYRVGIGYYQPADVWHSVAISNKVVMPPNSVATTADMHVATIPFHLSFQHLLDLFGARNETALAMVMSRFQERVLSSEPPKLLSPKNKKILRELGVSASDIKAAWRAFDHHQTETLAKRAGALPGFGASSPNRGFADTSWS